MAKRRRRRTHRRTTRTVAAAPVRRYRRRNPSRRRRVARAASRVRSTFAGMNFKQALKNVPAGLLGMFAFKFGAKRFGEAASETDPESWNSMSYIKGTLGALIAGFLAQHIRPGMGQKVLEGGLLLAGYKLVQNELVVKSETAMNWLGEDDTKYFPSEYVSTDSQGTPYLLGQNGQWYPVDERHRLPEYSGYGDQLEPPGRLGDQLEPPGRLGDAWQDAYFGQAADPFAKGFFGNS